jgi:hypothetical protein
VSDTATKEAGALLGDAALALVTGFLSLFGGAYVLSKFEMSTFAKTWIAIGVGLAGGAAMSKYSKPVGLGIAAGLGGLGLTAFIAEAAGAANSGKLFGFGEAKRAREGLPAAEPRRLSAAPTTAFDRFGPGLDRRTVSPDAVPISLPKLRVVTDRPPEAPF